MNLEALEPQNPLLRKPCQPVTRTELKTKKFQNMIESMLDMTYQQSNRGPKRDRNKHSIVGLSANQVGIDKRISIVDLAIGKNFFADIHVLINPEIIWKSRSTLERCEGCVNLPLIWGIVERSKRVKVKAIDRSGNNFIIDAHGWPAILLQHEIDHLNGTLFIDGVKNPTKALHVLPKDFKLFKKNWKSWKKFIDVSNLVTHK